MDEESLNRYTRNIENKTQADNIYFCWKSGNFISIQYVCDGVIDCLDGEEEDDCSSWDMHYFICQITNEIISVFQICDFISDCKDSTDEKFCGIC